MMLRSAHITQTTQSTLLPMLRERMGHTLSEILGGVLTGVLVAYGVNLGMPLLMAVV
jgi:acid phosphatase family membrane protein YuiD